MNSEYFNLKKKVAIYQEIKENTRAYRDTWKESLRDFIIEQLTTITTDVGLEAAIETVTKMENLEAVTLSLGDVKSGMYHEVSSSIKRHLIKHNGSLVYQQLFNGKVVVLINFPFIENYGEPQPPKTVGIYRPEELKAPFFLRHLEEFVSDIMNWEDYDDDEPNHNQRIGFKFNFNQGEEEVSEED